MIRLANPRDVEAIMSIVHGAQCSLAELGIDQWQNGYPSLDVIMADIERGVGYVLCGEDGCPIGYIAIVMDGEPAYLQITDSEWNTPNSYVVVHRLCVALDARREGVAVRMMRYAADVAREAGIKAFRIDTHRGNIRMLSMLEKLGFAYCGIVHYDSGERLAYDLNLDLSNVL